MSLPVQAPQFDKTSLSVPVAPLAGQSGAPRVRHEIDGVSIDDLIQRFGSPLFVFSERTIRQRFRAAQRAFVSRYANVQFAWSYKTNYLSGICDLYRQEGCFAEVVSEMEYDKARSLGVAGEQIIFNGPLKSAAALEKAVAEGAMVHIDHLGELADLESLAARLGRSVPAGIRLNLDAGIQPAWSRFGFNLESGEALQAVQRMADRGNVVLRGLHSHIGRSVMEPAAYAMQVEKLIRFSGELQQRFGISLEYLDIGGGFPSRSRLKSSGLPSNVASPSIEHFAAAIGDALARHLPPGKTPKLFIESGRALIDEAGMLVSTVVGVKRLPDGRNAYVADGGVNLLATSFLYDFDVELDREVLGESQPSVIYGPMCMNQDVVCENLLLPPLDRGTRLIFSPAGAYNVTQWMQFIAYRPNVVLIGSGGELDVIRAAEDLSDITRREQLPQRFRQ